MERTRPVFDQVNIVSSNTDASLAFYRRLGLDLPTERAWRTATGMHHASATNGASAANEAGDLGFDIDSTAFAQKWNTGWAGRADLKGRIVLGFAVASRETVDAIYADLTGEGYAGLQAPHDAFWGARYAVVEDPDGIAVGIMSPVSPDMRSDPPEM